MLVVCWLFQFSSVSSSVLVILRLRSCQYVVGSCWVAYVRSSPLLPSPKRRVTAVPSGGRPPGLFSVYNLRCFPVLLLQMSPRGPRPGACRPHCYAALLLQMAFLLRPCPTSMLGSCFERTTTGCYGRPRYAALLLPVTKFLLRPSLLSVDTAASTGPRPATQ